VRLPIRTPEKKKPELHEPVLESRSSPGLPLITSVDLLTVSEDSRSHDSRHEVPLDVQSI
jgi:hypothetical protein